MSIRLVGKFRPYCPACRELLPEEAGQSVVVYRDHVHDCVDIGMAKLRNENQRLVKLLHQTAERIEEIGVICDNLAKWMKSAETT